MRNDHDVSASFSATFLCFLADNY